MTVKSDGSGDATVNYTPVYGVSGYEFSAIGLENSVLLKYAQSSPNLQAMPSGLKVVPLVRAVDTDGNKSPWVVGGASTSQVSRSGVFSDDFANTVFSSNPSDGHFSESGHWYTMHPQYSGNYWPLISSESRLYLPGSTSNVGVAIANYTHSSANYSVVSDVTPLSEESARSVFILGRFDPTANTGYFFGYTAGTGFRLFKVVEGTQTQLGSTTSGNLGGHKHTLTLTMNGTTITGTAKDTVSGATVATISVTDSGISSVGRVGYRLSQGVTETTGVHMDNLFVLAVS